MYRPRRRWYALSYSLPARNRHRPCLRRRHLGQISLFVGLDDGATIVTFIAQEGLPIASKGQHSRKREGQKHQSRVKQVPSEGRSPLYHTRFEPRALPHNLPFAHRVRCFCGYSGVYAGVCSCLITQKKKLAILESSFSRCFKNMLECARCPGKYRLHSCVSRGPSVPCWVRKKYVLIIQICRQNKIDAATEYH